MNYNIVTYAVYFTVLLIVVLYVGSSLFRNGRIFLVNTFKGNELTADSVNRFLLAGYYLVNIGYTVIALKVWDRVASMQSVFETVCFKVGAILLTLGFMHLFNIALLIIIGKKKHY
ncbi:MAG: hypothetical protein ACJ77K_13060 [Bacteroidia bacterium]